MGLKAKNLNKFVGGEKKERDTYRDQNDIRQRSVSWRSKRHRHYLIAEETALLCPLHRECER